MALDAQKFLDAQESSYSTALAELQHGRKQSHWIWFVFPQLLGLGSSPMARRFGIQGLEEAAAYLAHPVLGARLEEVSKALLRLDARNPTAVLGSPDDLKLRSSMTLFAQVPCAAPVFQQVLDQYFGGQPDPRTLAMLKE